MKKAICFCQKIKMGLNFLCVTLKLFGSWGIKRAMKNFIWVLFFLGGCAAFEFPSTYSYREIETSDFKIAAWQKITNPNGLYRIYIEGDGYAFNAHGYPTNDPTPKSDLFRKMVLSDNSPNVIYLARPCQYVKNSQCSQKYWTTARFAPEVIDAEYEAIRELTHGSPVELIGFSGGAQIAGLMAVTKDIKVKRIITIAGNLDHRAWTEYHHLPPLRESLNLADYGKAFMRFNQIHYVGEDDEVIPFILTQKFVQNNSLVKIVPKATHNKGWDNFKIK